MKRQFPLSRLFFAVMLVAVLLGWWTDRNQLKKRIPKTELLVTKAYTVRHRVADVLIDELKPIYGEDIESFLAEEVSNSIFVSAQPSEHKKIALILVALDKPQRNGSQNLPRQLPSLPSRLHNQQWHLSDTPVGQNTSPQK